VTTQTYWCDAHLDFHAADRFPRVDCGDPLTHCEDPAWMAACPACQHEHALDEALAARRDR
jgi:hypothetical protein